MQISRNKKSRIYLRQNIYNGEKADDLTEDQLIQQGENKCLEFKSTLRWNIHSKQPDPVLENGVLKTVAGFLNTEGGILLVGVDDGGEVLGIEADNFPNEDKYLLHFANLLNNKIGKQFIEYVSWGMKEVQGNKIFRIDCKKSPSPVFIKISDRDELYVRSGPSTVPLSAKEVLEYSRSHFTNKV